METNPAPTLLVADTWTDYRLLDCGDGMKLEDWAGVKLLRPDPQVLWPKADGKSWQDYDARYERSGEGGGHWDRKRELPDSWQLKWKDLRFKVKPTDFKHTGIFPEQAANWAWSMDKIATAGRPIRLLNLFGYTGGATIAAAKAGAEVSHVDAAKGMVEWCKENAALSGVAKAPIRYLVDDCSKFVERESRRGATYDALVLDPPSFGRGKSGETWKLEKHLWPLLQSCAKVLSDKPLYILINSYTTGLSPLVLGRLLQAMRKGKPGHVSQGELGLPIVSGGVLPCGVYGRWEAP